MAAKPCRCTPGPFHRQRHLLRRHDCLHYAPETEVVDVLRKRLCSRVTNCACIAGVRDLVAESAGMRWIRPRGHFFHWRFCCLHRMVWGDNHHRGTFVLSRPERRSFTAPRRTSISRNAVLTSSTASGRRRVANDVRIQHHRRPTLVVSSVNGRDAVAATRGRASVRPPARLSRTVDAAW